MQAFIVLLALAGAASAALPKAIQPESIPEEIETRTFSGFKILNVYGAPNAYEFYPVEKTGVKGLFSHPFILAYQPAEGADIRAVFLDGVEKSYMNVKLNASQKVEGPEMIALYYSAAQALEIPQFSLPLKQVVVPFDKLPYTASVVTKYFAQGLPVVYMVLKDKYPADVLKKVTLVGQFAMYSNKAEIYKDFVSY